MAEQSRESGREKQLVAVEQAIDDYVGIFRMLRGAGDLGEYLAAAGTAGDEESLTEPIFRAIIERVLGFPRGAYVEQLGKSGRKPDFTPVDLIAHPFVLDAKASNENLARHERQIRGYMDQRRLTYGVLFSLKELRVYRSGAEGYERSLSFPVLPLWRVARGEALPGDEIERLHRFVALFHYREATLEQKVKHLSEQRDWASRFAAGETFAIDVEALVERLRRLAAELADDASAQMTELERFLSFDPGRERKLLEELELLALEIAPGTDPDRLPKSVADWRSASDVPAAVWRQFLIRVAHLALARILLYRAWEDVQFVESYLYDGGFHDWYEQLGQNARRVLEEAFAHGSRLYPWLFGRENNYDWYQPSEGVLVDVLYTLASEPLGKLDADVLGGLYESYVEEIDRDRLGQFFTPRDVVRFMLDQAGFAGAERIFRVEGGERKPRHILDFATGSGGFLVEAARRIIDEVDADRGDPRDLHEALRAIVTGFTGGEISPFPYYLTEINLLLQVSRLLGPLQALQDRVPPFGALGVLPVDTLSAKSGERSLEEFDPALRADKAEPVADERYGLVPLDGAKLTAYRERLSSDDFFDLVVGNPPYVAEANNKPLFDRLRAIPAWRGIYRGKTDYAYYFLWLAVEKLAPGGRLCVITPAGWMNAGAADFLREKLASELTLEMLFLFGSYRLFATEGSAPTPTVESAILIARKGRARKNHKLRVVALEDEREAPSDRHELLEEMARRARGKAGRKGGIHVHGVPQVSLRAEHAWPVKQAADDVSTRVVAHLQALLDDATKPVEPLNGSWKVFLGIQTGADAYSRKIMSRLTPEVRRRVEAERATIGEPIYALPPGSESEAPWASSDSLVRSPEPEAVLYGALDEENYVNLVWLTRDNPPSASVLAAVERWRLLLAARAEFVRNPRRSWWETCWPRKRRDLEAPKVIALHRTDRGRFALDEAGVWSPSGRMCVVVARETEGPVAYLCGLLNSELLDLWYALRGRRPRDIWRDYEPKPMGEMPYRRPDGDPRADQIADLVPQIAANRRALLSHRAVVADLGRIVKDPWKAGPVEIDEPKLVEGLPSKETISVRLDPDLDVGLYVSARSKPARASKNVLALMRGRKEIGRITGDPARLDLLEKILGGKADERVRDTLLPKDLGAFAQGVRETRELVSGLLEEGRRLVEDVERLVCAVYDVPEDLADEVVAHAVARASR